MVAGARNGPLWNAAVWPDLRMPPAHARAGQQGVAGYAHEQGQGLCIIVITAGCCGGQETSSHHGASAQDYADDCFSFMGVCAHHLISAQTVIT